MTRRDYAQIVLGRKMNKDKCFVCGRPFEGTEPRWCAALRVSPDRNNRNLWTYRWEVVCGDDFWDESPRGRRAGVRKDIDGEV